MNSDGDGTPSLPPHPMVGPPFHRRPRAAKMAAPHAGRSQLVATELAVAQERDPPVVAAPVGGRSKLRPSPCGSPRTARPTAAAGNRHRPSIM